MAREGLLERLKRGFVLYRFSYDQVSRNVAVQLLNFFGGKPVSPQLTLEQIARST